MVTTLICIAFLAAVALAWVSTSRCREHRPTAVLMSLVLGSNVAQLVLDRTVLAPLRAELGVERPWVGWAWAAALASHSITLTVPAAFAGPRPPRRPRAAPGSKRE